MISLPACTILLVKHMGKPECKWIQINTYISFITTNPCVQWTPVFWHDLSPPSHSEERGGYLGGGVVWTTHEKLEVRKGILFCGFAPPIIKTPQPPGMAKLFAGKISHCDAQKDVGRHEKSMNQGATYCTGDLWLAKIGCKLVYLMHVISFDRCLTLLQMRNDANLIYPWLLITRHTWYSFFCAYLCILYWEKVHMGHEVAWQGWVLRTFLGF